MASGNLKEPNLFTNILYQHKNDEKSENIERTVREKSNPTPK